MEKQMNIGAYINGFCKAAESFGIDPVELVKFSQEYRTNGWAPDTVVEFDQKNGRRYFPAYSPDRFGGDNIIFHENVTNSHSLSPELVDSIPSNTTNDMRSLLARGRMAYDQRYREWYSAHNKAVGNSVNHISKLLSDKQDDKMNVGYKLSNKQLSELLGKLYHNNMYSLTNTPVRVSKDRVRQ